MVSMFYNIYKVIAKNKLLGLTGFILIVGLLGFIGSQIKFEEDITKLIPVTDANRDLQKVLKTVNFDDKIIVNISKIDSGSQEDLVQLATSFLDSLNTKAGTYIEDVKGKVDDSDIAGTIDFVYHHLPFFLEAEDYSDLNNKLNGDSINAITKANYKALISPSGLVAKKYILQDPLGLSYMGLNKLKKLSLGDDFNVKNGFLFSNDGNHILLFITPSFASGDTGENAKLSDQLYAIKDTLDREFIGRASIAYFGGALVAVENAKQIKHDIQFTVGIAIVVLLLILIVFYNRIFLPVILFVPTIFGALIAVVVLSILRDSISAVSLGIGSILLGITLDYSLHVLTHIRQNSDVKALYQEIAKSVLMSSLTTALAFLCLLFIKSQALQDLGIFAAVSVLGAAFCALLFIPHVYGASKNKKTRKTFIDTFCNIQFHKVKWLFVVIAALGVLSAFTYNKVTFNNDISKLNYEPPELMEAQHNLEALTSIGSKSVYLAAYGNTVQEALEANDVVFKKLNILAKKGSIIDFSSVGYLVRSNGVQHDYLQQWNTFWNDSTKQQLQQNLIESGAELGFKPKTFQKFYELLGTDFRIPNLSDYNNLNTIDIADYVAAESDFATVTTLVKLDEKLLQDFVSQFENMPHVVLIDRKGMNETFLGNLKNDFNQLVIYSLVVVLVVLLLFYKSFSITLVTGLPIVITWFLTIGLMGLFHMEFNIFNIIISTFIFGLGVDYSIFITNGLLHEYRTGEKVLATPKMSIVLSVLTTILGVGVLIFAKHPALYTIAWVCVVGILCAMVISFTIQPVLFRVFIGGPENRRIKPGMLLHSVFSFVYYGLGAFVLSVKGIILIRLFPKQKDAIAAWFHKLTGGFMTSVLYTNPFVTKRIINKQGEDFKKPGIIIANHTSFLDTPALEMLHPKLIFLVNDWVYNSPVFGRAMEIVGYYPVSQGIENGLDQIKSKIDQGYSVVVFPEGTRSKTNRINRFHKGAFYLSEELGVDIIPVLIHGNSEVNPKGSFAIRNGSITVKVLPRISPGDIKFGNTSRERAKYVGAHVREEFRKLRDELEGATYFNEVILDEFRYKGNTLYKSVKQDLELNTKLYHKLIRLIASENNVAHITDTNGHLDFLMALDKAERKIVSYIADETMRTIARNSYNFINKYKIKYIDFGSVIEAEQISCLIIHASESMFEEIKNYNFIAITRIVLLKQSCVLKAHLIEKFSFTTTEVGKEYCILEK